MKRLFFPIITLLVAILLCACQTDKAVAPEVETTEDAQPTTVRIIMTTSTANPSESQKAAVVTTYNTRLLSAGYTEATVQIADRNEPFRVIVTVPNANAQEIIDLLSGMGYLSFQDASGYEVLNGTDIAKAEYAYSIGYEGYEDSVSPHQVKLVLTELGCEKFSLASENAAALQPTGQYYISIVLDGNLISQPNVTEKITSKELVITGNFTTESAQYLASMIQGGTLPFSMEVAEYQTIDLENDTDKD